MRTINDIEISVVNFKNKKNKYQPKLTEKLDEITLFQISNKTQSKPSF